MMKTNGITNGKFVNAFADASVKFLNGIENTPPYGKYVLVNNHASAVPKISSDFGATFTNTALSATNSYSCSMSNDGKYMIVSYTNNGYMFLSSNYGATWTQKGILGFWNLVSMSSSGQYIVAYDSSTGIYMSVDYGSTFNKVNSVLPTSAHTVSISGNGKYVSFMVSGSKYTSSNYGASGSFAVLTVGAANCVFISETGMYQFIGKSTGLNISSNYGSSFTNISGTAYSIRSISGSGDAKYIIATVYGTGILVSSNYGATFTLYSLVKNFSINCSVSFDGKRQIVPVDDGNGYISNDYGVTWSELASINSFKEVSN